MYDAAKKEAEEQAATGAPPRSARSDARFWFRMLDGMVILALLCLLVYGLQRDYGINVGAKLAAVFPREAAVFRRVAADVAWVLGTPSSSSGGAAAAGSPTQF